MSRGQAREVSVRDVMDAEDLGGPAYTLEICRAFLDRHPDHWLVCLSMGKALVDMDRREEAKRLLKRADELCPAEARHHVMWGFGHLHKESGEYAEAEHWYRLALRDPQVGEETISHVFLGACLIR